MAGKCTTDRKKVKKVRMVERDHEIIAHFLCKLLSLPAYDHLMEILKGDEDAMKACGSWKVGEKPTEELVKWCRYQYRRMKPVVNYQQAGEVSSSTVMRSTSCLPCCHICGALCANCAKDMDKEIPEGDFEHVLLNIFDRETDETCNDEPAGVDITEPISERVKRRRTTK